MKNYFDSITSDRNDYLIKQPKKADVLNNAKIAGNVSILGGSNNRAVVIKDGNTVYLQSYDTIVLSVDILTGTIKKMWNGYTATTLKHVNAFLKGFNGQQFNKKSWENFTEV
jgi:hypothetical protein